jgi:hypothetical protein
MASRRHRKVFERHAIERARKDRVAMARRIRREEQQRTELEAELKEAS